jgi:uncharacterized protein YndB with AHSA1/START domain
MSQDRELPPLVFERVVPHPVERVWRVMIQPELIAKWLMRNDFAPIVGHRFTFRAQPVPGWSGITNCVVKEVIPQQKIVYTWGDGSESDSGLQTLATWTLSPEAGGTRIRLEHSGFREKDTGGYKGMGGGWPHIFERIEATARTLED